MALRPVRAQRACIGELPVGEIMRQPPWLLRARLDIGKAEIPGKDTAPFIWRALGQIQAQWLGGDEAPWCGTILAGWMLDVGIIPPLRPYRALNWRDWGIALGQPIVGAVGVMERVGGGHVTLIVGQDSDGHLLGLGGNQDDGVRVSAFKRSRFKAYRWPAEQPYEVATLPIGNASEATRLA